MSDTFYRDFEARFRGNPAVIQERLWVYEPFLKPLAAQGNAKGLDLGCGRGEWLEVMAAIGLEARGVDLDQNMLDVARAKGLRVEHKDALQALRAVPSGTLAVVSAFHLIEHLTFNLVRDLIIEARRALRPGGIIILETPNPENPVVGLINFHLDPTHVKPLPPLLTHFVAEHAGFARSVILRLQGSMLQSDRGGALMSILTDVSLDYAIVAQVAAPLSTELDAAFDIKLGIDLHDAVRRFDDTSATQLAKIYGQIGSLERAVSDEVARQRTEVSRSLRSLEGVVAKISISQNQESFKLITDLERKITHQAEMLSALKFRLDRSWLERLLFRPSGRPVKALRRLVFHTNGKPRGIFRNMVLGPHRSPRRAFRQWMESSEYLALSWPTAASNIALFPQSDDFLKYKPQRPRPPTLPLSVMTVEELITRADSSINRQDKI